MKRSPLGKSRTALKRRTALKTSRRRIRVKGKSRFPKKRDPEYCEWVRRRWCVLWLRGDCSGRLEVAHVKSRGAGGGDVGNVVPLCTKHHARQHTMGRSAFEMAYRRNLATEAQYLAEV